MTDTRSETPPSGERRPEREHSNSPRQRFLVWRESLRGRRRANLIYRCVVGLLGGAIVIGGLALIPLPGPGWVIVFVGLAVLATEFTWAKRLEQFARREVGKWTDWVGRQSLAVRILLGLATFVLVVAVLYAVSAVIGVPGFIPSDWYSALPGLD